MSDALIAQIATLTERVESLETTLYQFEKIVTDYLIGRPDSDELKPMRNVLKSYNR